MVPMAKDHQIAVRVNDPTYEAIESFAEKHDYTKAEAARRMIEDRLAGEGHLESGRAVPDGGQILDRINAIEQQQTQRLDEIEQDIETAFEDEPTKIEKWISGMQIWSAGLTLAGIVGYFASSFGGTGINADLAFWFMGLSAFFVLLFTLIQDVIA